MDRKYLFQALATKTVDFYLRRLLEPLKKSRTIIKGQYKKYGVYIYIYMKMLTKLWGWQCVNIKACLGWPLYLHLCPWYHKTIHFHLVPVMLYIQTRYDNLHTQCCGFYCSGHKYISDDHTKQINHLWGFYYM